MPDKKNGGKKYGKKTRKSKVAVHRDASGKKVDTGHGKRVKTQTTVVTPKPIYLPKFSTPGERAAVKESQISSVAIPKKDYKKAAKDKLGRKGARKEMGEAKEAGRVINKVSYSTIGHKRKARKKRY